MIDGFDSPNVDLDVTESAVRAALNERGARITTDALRQPSMRTALSGRGRRPMRAALLAAAAVVAVTAVVFGIAIAIGPRSPDAASGGRSTPAFIGSRWLLVAVDTNGSRTPIPATIGATVEFAAGGDLLMDDGVNGLSGVYDVTDTGFVTHDVFSAAVGWIGSDKAKLIAIQAIDAIAYGPRPYGPAGRPNVPVQATTTGDQLTLRVAGYVMSFRRVGPAATPQLGATTTPLTTTPLTTTPMTTTPVVPTSGGLDPGIAGIPSTGFPDTASQWSAPPPDQLPTGCAGGPVTITYNPGGTGSAQPAICIRAGATLSITLAKGISAWSPLQVTPSSAATVTHSSTSANGTLTATVRLTAGSSFTVASASEGTVESDTRPIETWTLHVTVRP